MTPEMSIMWRHIPWRLVLLALGLALAAFLAAGQAVTFAWLSSFPERASQLQSLETKFWGFAALSVVLGAAALALFIRVIKKINERRRRDRARSIKTNDAELE